MLMMTQEGWETVDMLFTFGQQRLFGNPWDTPVIAQAPCVRTSQRPESAGAPPQVIPTTCHGWPGDQVTTCHGWRAKPSEHCAG